MATLSQYITGNAAGVSSLNVVLSSAVSSGNSLMCFVGYFRTPGGGSYSTIADNVHTNGFTLRGHSTMSNASDTGAHLLLSDRLNISSGAGASTYRVRVEFTGGAASPSMYVGEYGGGPYVFSQVVGANGNSSGPAGGAATSTGAAASQALFVSGAIHNSTSQFASTATGGNAVYVVTVDPTNSGQITNIVHDINPSSLQENIGHSMTSSTRWFAGTAVYTGPASSGGAAARLWSPAFTMLGCQ